MNVKVLLFSLLGALLATTALVLLMSVLVSPDIREAQEKRKTIILGSVDLIDPVIKNKEKPKETPKQEQPVSEPTPPTMAPPKQAPTQKTAINDLFDFADPQIQGLNSSDLAINPINSAPTNLNQTPSFSREAQVVIRSLPVYPQSAKKRNISGYVKIGFIIDGNGKAYDIQILESEPAGVFDRVSIKAVQKTKFQPVVEGGEIIKVEQFSTYTFEL